MSRQRHALPRIIEDLSMRYPGCGILVSGSVQRGEERADSDIDLFVVCDEGGPIRLEHETGADGIGLDVAVFPEKALQRDAASEWYKFWMFSRAAILHDPAGIAGRNQALVRRYFRDHPDVDRAWEEQLAEVRRHKADRSYALQYPTWDAFVKHITGMVNA